MLAPMYKYTMAVAAFRSDLSTEENKKIQDELRAEFDADPQLKKWEAEAQEKISSGEL
jgi:hypothetical protein